MVLDEGFEPSTFGLQNRCTSAVLIQLNLVALVGIEPTLPR
jgi:hypothetical protein